MASASNIRTNSNSWTEKFENIYRDLKELWLDTQDVLQLANPRYGLLTRFDNLDDETKAKLAEMKVKVVLKSVGRTEEVQLYIPKYDSEEIKAGIRMIHQMGFVFTFQNLEQFVHRLFEACISYIVENVKGPNLMCWQRVVYLCVASQCGSNELSSPAKELYEYLQDKISVEEEINEGSSDDYLNFIQEHFLPMPDSPLKIFEFLTIMRLEKLDRFQIDSIFEALMDILPFDFQKQNEYIRKQSKCNLKLFLTRLFEFLLSYHKSDREKSKYGKRAQSFDSSFINKDTDIHFVIDENGKRERFYIRPKNIQTIQNLINLYYGLSLHNSRGSQRNSYATWRYLRQENPDFDILVSCGITDADNEIKSLPAPGENVRVESRLKQLWNNARTNENEENSADEYANYMNARDFSRYLENIIGKFVTVIMMIKFREAIIRIPYRDPHHRSKVNNRASIPRTASIFGLEAQDIDFIVSEMNQQTNNYSEDALK